MPSIGHLGPSARRSKFDSRFFIILPPLGAPTPRAAEWPGNPPGMAPPGVPRVTPRNFPLFGSEDSATGDSSQSRGGGGSIDWRP